MKNLRIGNNKTTPPRIMFSAGRWSKVFKVLRVIRVINDFNVLKDFKVPKVIKAHRPLRQIFHGICRLSEYNSIYLQRHCRIGSAQMAFRLLFS